MPTLLVNGDCTLTQDRDEGGDPKPGGAADKAGGGLPTVAASSSDSESTAPLLTDKESKLGVMHAAGDAAEEEEQ